MEVFLLGFLLHIIVFAVWHLLIQTLCNNVSFPTPKKKGKATTFPPIFSLLGY